MIIRYWRLIAGLLIGLCVPNWGVYAETRGWNPVYDHVTHVFAAASVREDGVQFDQYGGLVEGEESKFWLRRNKINEIVTQEVFEMIRSSRPDIELSTRPFGYLPYSKNPKIGKYENGNRRLILLLTFQKMETPYENRYIGVATFNLRREHALPAQHLNSQSELEECEPLWSYGRSAYSGKATIFQTGGSDEKVDEDIRQAVRTAMMPMVESLAKGDRAAP